MKKCPFCSAEILDDAEFCLYCMRQLDNKTAVKNKIKKPHWWVIIGILLALLACIIVLLIIKFGGNNHQGHILSSDEPTGFYSSQSSVVSGSESIGSIDNSIDANSNLTEKNNADSNSNTQAGTTHTSTAGDDNSSIDNTTSISPSWPPSSSNSSIDSSTSGAQSNENSLDPTGSTPSDNQQNEEPKQAWLVKEIDGGVEIIGVNDSSISGICEIPSQINGKAVVSIGYKAFADCNYLTTVIIPASVKSIGINAFLPCDKLADIYIASENISISSNAFSNSYQRSVTLTIHAPSSVMDRFKAMAWDAEYEEWNG